MSNKIGILNWLNETSLSPYPLTKSFLQDSFLIDANFIQFDAFVPVLDTVEVTATTITLNITFDFGSKAVVLNKDDFTGAGYTIKVTENDRFLGKLVFGDGVNDLFLNFTDQTLNVGISFLNHLVKSIPSGCGVFSIDELYGEITYEHDSNIWYDVDGNDITFNAVGLVAPSDECYLKTLNSVEPVNNAVSFGHSPIIKFSSPYPGAILVSLVGSSVENLVVENNSTIISNLTP